jgi:hypothetical protein
MPRLARRSNFSISIASVAFSHSPTVPVPVSSFNLLEKIVPVFTLRLESSLAEFEKADPAASRRGRCTNATFPPPAPIEKGYASQSRQKPAQTSSCKRAKLIFGIRWFPDFRAATRTATEQLEDSAFQVIDSEVLTSLPRDHRPKRPLKPLSAPVHSRRRARRRECTAREQSESVKKSTSPRARAAPAAAIGPDSESRIASGTGVTVTARCRATVTDRDRDGHVPPGWHWLAP